MSFLFPKMPSMPAPPQLELPKAEDVPSYQDQEREKAELEKRLEDVQNKYNAYVKKGVEKGWIDNLRISIGTKEFSDWLDQ